MNIPVVMMSASPINRNRKRQILEKSRIQKLKSWHEDVKKIARSELDFITSIFKDDKDSEDRDWLRDYESDDEGQKDSGEVVKKES